ncbi:MAG: hypothetical protein O2805_03185 [Proteobacteria bacterium]|nr:hypothetical protein [Pseudomonadota bacterium]
MLAKIQPSILHLTALGLTAVALSGCATSTPTIDTGAEATFDGLYPVKGGRMDAAWARPGFNIEPYSKVMLEGVGIEYRPGGESGRSFHTTRSGEYFEK